MAGNTNGQRPQRNSREGDTIPFGPVKKTPKRRPNDQLAREKQRRQYEQQKKEQLVFLLFVVVIIALILVAILVFKKVLDNGEAPDTSDSGSDTVVTTDSPDTSGNDTEPTVEYRREMRSAEDVHKGLLLLVDDANPYKGGKPELADIYSGRTKFPKSEKTVYSYYLPDDTIKVGTETLAALNRLADDFYTKTGNNDLYVDRAYTDTLAEHASGLAVDLSVWTIDEEHFLLDSEDASDDFEWILSNYYQYGFVMQTPAESGERYFHFRYVGLPAAEVMYRQKLELPSFLELLRKNHAYEADKKIPSLSFTAEDGATYEIYYVEATGGDMTGIPIPEGALYQSISGDNQNGFVVTVRMS